MSRHAATWRPELLPLVLCLMACGTARRSETIGPQFASDDVAVQRGELVFMHRCHKCHPLGTAGLGPAIHDKPLPAFLIRTQVRQGFGMMPAFDADLIDEAQLEDLVAYLQARRGHGRAP